MVSPSLALGAMLGDGRSNEGMSSIDGINFFFFFFFFSSFLGVWSARNCHRWDGYWDSRYQMGGNLGRDYRGSLDVLHKTTSQRNDFVHKTWSSTLLRDLDSLDMNS